MWRVKLKHALIRINDIYFEGCVKKYESMSHNSWLEQHDILEAVLKIGSDLDIKNAIDVFEKNITGLIRRYQT